MKSWYNFRSWKIILDMSQPHQQHNPTPTHAISISLFVCNHAKSEKPIQTPMPKHAKSLLLLLLLRFPLNPI
jgi:hypothetical protein